MRKKFLVSIEISLFHEKAVLAGEQFSYISSIILDVRNCKQELKLNTHQVHGICRLTNHFAPSKVYGRVSRYILHRAD